ncbi:MAG TPA: hypothetical protein VLX92_06150 [Kofleriaceae bacterium]|nr:hypothetical protein [Kofleriaceae bacterium]
MTSRAPTAALVVSSCATLAAIALWLAFVPSSRDDCALPGGLAGLAPATQAEAARHELACRDLEHGRIGGADYLRLIGAPPAQRAAPVERVAWASRVIAFSSEYSPTSWSAHQVLGPPDVFPGSGDNARAWASRDADGQSEFIEVGFDHPIAMRELRIYETYNPGAISSVEVTTVWGRKIALMACSGTFTTAACDGPMAIPSGGAQISRVPLRCDVPIASVRVTLASAAVPGWNEIDAIGGVACDD